MRFGYCLNLQFLEGDDLSRRIFDAVCESGFDYVEFPLNALSALSPDKIAGLKRELAAKGVPCRACNLFFPFDMPIVGPERDRKVIRNYIEKAIATAADIGMETAVFGNGGARRANDGLSKAGVYADLRDIIEMMDPIAEKNGVTITVEPLNQKETNMINSYTEAVQLTEGAKHVAAMCDWYHVVMEGQTLDDLQAYPDRLRHLHIAYSKERLIPSLADDTEHYRVFVDVVKQLGYSDKLSVEGSLRGNGSEAAEIGACLEALKGLFEGR